MVKKMYPILRGKMAELGYTYKALAKEIGISETTFANKIHGRSPWFLDEIMAIIKIMDVPFEELFRK